MKQSNIRTIKLLRLIAFTWALSCIQGHAAQENTKFNVDQNGVLLHGYDVISYFEEGGLSPKKGSRIYEIEYNGVKYWFANQKHANLFRSSPEKYIPAFGGWSTTDLSGYALVDIDPTIYTIVGDRIFFFSTDQYGRQNFLVKFSQKVYTVRAEAFWAHHLGGGKVPYCVPQYPAGGIGFYDALLAPVGSQCRTNTESVITKVEQPGFSVAFADELGKVFATNFRAPKPTLGLLQATPVEAIELCQKGGMHLPQIEELNAQAKRTGLSNLFSLYGGLGGYLLSSSIWEFIRGQHYYAISLPDGGTAGSVPETESASFFCFSN